MINNTNIYPQRYSKPVMAEMLVEIHLV